MVNVCKKGSYPDCQNQSTYNVSYYGIRWVIRELAYFDGLIGAISGVAVAIFTWTLWRSTEKLWISGERQRASDNKARESDAVHLAESLRISKASSEAASKSADALIAANRAFVYINRHMFGWFPGEKLWIGPEWGNSGSTPTINMKTHVRVELRSKPLPKNFDFDYPIKDFYEGFIGPRTVIMGARLPLGGLDISDIYAVGEKRKFLYLMGLVKYNDIFPNTKEHVTRFCLNVDFIPNANSQFGINVLFNLHPKNNSAD